MEPTSGSQTQQIMEFAEKQLMNIDDLREMYLFKFEKGDVDVYRQAKEKINHDITEFIKDYISPIGDEDNHAPSGMMQYYMRLWSDKDFYQWYGREERTNINELEELKIKAEASAKLFSQDLEVLVKFDPKILNAKFQEDIMGFTRKRNTWEIYQRLFKEGDIDDWYETLMKDEELKRMYDMNYEWIPGARDMNMKCQLCITLLIRPQTELKNFTHSRKT